MNRIEIKETEGVNCIRGKKIFAAGIDKVRVCPTG
jgi:hypothetical protein